MTNDDRVAALETERAKLRAENETLRAAIYGKSSGRPIARAEPAALNAVQSSVCHDSSTTDKVSLFRSLFRGREDI